MISEVYVPRARLGELMGRLRDDFRRNTVGVIYGTVRFIERDDETFLPWARESFACVVLNFHVDDGAAGLEKARADFQRLIDHALALDGSYFLTYHRWARRDQLDRAYPQFEAFLREKLAWDPDERFQSDWYRHYRSMFLGL
jgi:FAD/FMN-containing dehydrogenase